jgi:hypothetical protein
MSLVADYLRYSCSLHAACCMFNLIEYLQGKYGYVRAIRSCTRGTLDMIFCLLTSTPRTTLVPFVYVLTYNNQPDNGLTLLRC